MKPRRIVITFEVETNIKITQVKELMGDYIEDNYIQIMQVQANVIKGEKSAKRRNKLSK